MNLSFSDFFRTTRLLLATMSILILSACQNMSPYQAYEGEAKSDDEVAIFNIPGPYNLLAIDGVKFNRLTFGDGAIIQLLPGSHQLIIEYQDFWDDGGVETEKITSKPMSITFTAQAGVKYTIKVTKFETVEEVQEFADQPDITVIDTTNKQTVSAQVKYNLFGTGLFATLFGGENSEPARPSTATSNTSTNTVNTNKAVKEGQAYQMLRYWWETADKEQRANFRQWLESH